jgi:hypothetical protein
MCEPTPATRGRLARLQLQTARRVVVPSVARALRNEAHVQLCLTLPRFYWRWI